MNVVKWKRRTSYILNTGMLLVSISHIIVNKCLTWCLKHLGPYDRVKQILGGRGGDNAPQHVSCTSYNDAFS